MGQDPDRKRARISGRVLSEPAAPARRGLRPRGRVGRFLLLPPHERRLLIRAAAVQPLLRLALRFGGLARTQSLLARWTPLPGRPLALAPSRMREAVRMAALVASAARHGLLVSNCLTGSLTLWWLLRRRGIGGELRIGVRRAGAALEAHAWVEYEGHVLNDAPDVGDTYAPLAGTVHILRAGAP